MTCSGTALCTADCSGPDTTCVLNAADAGDVVLNCTAADCTVQATGVDSVAVTCRDHAECTTDCIDVVGDCNTVCLAYSSCEQREK
jgi:hypothetical protein